MQSRTRPIERLVDQLRAKLDDARRRSERLDRRPRVFFEEWDEPLISGIGWLIGIAGGVNVFDTEQVEALIAGTYLAGTNTRRVRRALAALFRGAIGKDTVSRIWRKVKTDWEAWSKRPLGEEDIVRLILDGHRVAALGLTDKDTGYGTYLGGAQPT